MNICICKAVTDAAICEAVFQGVHQIRDLRTCLGVADQCSAFACHVKMLLEQTLMQKIPMQYLSSKPAR